MKFLILFFLTTFLALQAFSVTNYSSSAVNHPYTTSISAGQVNAHILRIAITGDNVGAPGNYQICRMLFTMNNTSDADVLNAKLYYSGTDAALADGTAGATLLGTIANPSGTITFNFTQTLSSKTTYYFYLSFDISAGAGACNTFDAYMPAGSIGYTNANGGCPAQAFAVPTTPDPAGSRQLPGPGCLTYCESKASVTTSNMIDRVVFNTISNTSSNCADYSDFRNISTIVIPGQTYLLSISKKNCSGNNEPQAKFAAWIDYNRNGTFEASEKVFDGNVGGVAGAASGNVTIPAAAVTGRTVLRCIMVEGNPNTTVSVCGTYNEGETEDYSIDIAPLTCANNIKDGTETDVDCGGSCPPCIDCSLNETCSNAMFIPNNTVVNGCNIGNANGPAFPTLPACNMSNTATSWFSFTTGPQDVAVTIRINSTCFTNPQFAIFSNCGTVLSSSCTVGSFDLIGYTPLTPNTTYYLAVTDANGGQCHFSVFIQTFPDLDQCNVSSTLIANATPPFSAGQTVEFTYDILDWNKVGCNWVHGIVPKWGPCWDPASFTSVQGPASAAGDGSWGWYANGVVTYNINGLFYKKGDVVGAGWFFLRLGDPGYLSNNPNATWGDAGISAGGNCSDPSSTWRVRFRLKVKAICDKGVDCMVSVKTFGDGETGNWDSPGCLTDLPTVYNAQADPNNCVVTVSAKVLSFRADNQGNSVKLSWTTESEQNNEKFVVMRSTDFRNFVPVSTTTGAGNSSSRRSYSTIDHEAPKGLVYYQLHQVNYNGSVTQSKVIGVNVATAADMLDIYPNPVSGNGELRFYSFRSEPVNVAVFDMKGSPVMSAEVKAAEGFNTANLEFSALSPGVYIISLKNEQEVIRKRFIKQ